MPREFEIKKRGKERRKRKPVYLLISEGRNKTETNYFSHFQNQAQEYSLRMVKAGNNTDIESLYNIIERKWTDLKLSEEEGDKAFIVFDLDNDDDKISKTKKVIKLNDVIGISFVSSNPTFEIWFLLHFRNTAKYYADGKAVITDLKKYIADYSKNRDVFELCEPKMKDALDNTEKLRKHFLSVESDLWKCNPMTEVDRLIKILINP